MMWLNSILLLVIHKPSCSFLYFVNPSIKLLGTEKLYVPIMYSNKFMPHKNILRKIKNQILYTLISNYYELTTF